MAPLSAGSARLGDILGVGRQNAVGMGAQRRGHTRERAVLLVRRGQSEHAGSRTRRTADFGHDGGDIAGALDAFQRRGHEKRPVCPGTGCFSYHVGVGGAR